MRSTSLLPALALTAVLAGIGAPACGADQTPAFGSVRAPSHEAVRSQAADWLKSTGMFDQAAFDAVWSQSDRPIIDLVADTFALGNADARALLADVRDANSPAPTQMPGILNDAKQPGFFRANLALAYAQALTTRRLYDEALAALQGVKAEQVAEHVIDPAAYYFQRAVAEHRTLQKDDAARSIARLLDEIPDAPERYKMVAALMALDLQQWKAKDLGDIDRKMDRIKDRLGNAQGGPRTRQYQREVLARLDELIKRIENDRKKQEPSDDPKDPSNPPQEPPRPGDRPPTAGDPNNPQDESRIGLNRGNGDISDRKMRDIVELWGKLKEKDRVNAMTEMIRSMPPAYRQMIEDFYRKGAATQP
jgi:tetratricopeptide (TPR) repeat protein